MKPRHDHALHLRLPETLALDLDAITRASGGRLSVTARAALTIGVRVLRSSDVEAAPPAPVAAPIQAAAA